MFSRTLSVARPLCRRSFASAAAADSVELPVQLFGLSATYANALFRTATRAGTLGAVEKDLQGFKSLISSTPALHSYLNNPIISRKDKAEDISKISARMTETTRGFLGVLAENGRLGEVTKIIDTFDQLMKAKQGIVEARVVSAQALTKKTTKGYRRRCCFKPFRERQETTVDGRS
mmetsp:Transcript_16006/g.20500  ORF Transcript_16006/g.20500 Transcript_16006/m.20500 type:complete len:176 (-) Transcript_16006:269-796(-)